MPPTLNAKGKKFYWSYSALKNFEGCPFRYAHASFYCTTPFIQSEAAIWGDRVHKAGEMFLKGVPHPDTEALIPVEPYVTAILRAGYRPEPELEITLAENLFPTGWFAKNAWLRVKIDVVLTKDKLTALLYDWKTGKVRVDPDQLRLCAAVLSMVRPHYERFEGKFIYTKHKVVKSIEPILKAEIPAIWEDFLIRAAKMERAWDREDFPAKPSGLCPWCSVEKCHKRQGEMRK